MVAVTARLINIISAYLCLPLPGITSLPHLAKSEAFSWLKQKGRSISALMRGLIANLYYQHGFVKRD